MLKLCDIDPATDAKLPGNFSDKSGLGVHYANAYLKQMTGALPDGTKVMCKRKGLKLILRVGTKKGEGLMRRLEHGPDVKNILFRALEEAAAEAGVGIEANGSEVRIAP